MRTGVLNDVGLIDFTALVNSIITRGMETARKAVVIRILLARHRTQTFLLLRPVVNDSPSTEICAINENALVT